MNTKNVFITIKKELKIFLRDKKAVATLLITLFLIPSMCLLMGGVFSMTSKSEYLVGTNYEMTNEETTIIQSLGDLKTKHYSSVESLEKAYEDGDIQGYVVKEDNKYTIYADTSQTKGEMIVSYLSTYLDTYNQSLGNKYLIEQGVDLNNVYNNVSYEVHDLGDPSRNILLKMIGTVVVMLIILSTVSTAGSVISSAMVSEKENGTLETTLTFPIRMEELIAGKYFSAVIVSLLVSVIAACLVPPSFALTLKMTPELGEVFSFSLDSINIPFCFLILILNAFLSTGVVMFLLGKAKSTKEIQTKMMLPTYVAMVPYFTSFLDISLDFIYFVPIANCTQFFQDIFNKTITTEHTLIVIGTTIVYTIAVIILFAKSYKSEKVIFAN